MTKLVSTLVGELESQRRELQARLEAIELVLVSLRRCFPVAAPTRSGWASGVSLKKGDKITIAKAKA